MSTYLGQNFLKDFKYIDFVVQKIKKINPEIIMEIGPGKGALTKYLVDCCQEINLFEKDLTFIDNLTNLIKDKGKIFQGDFLEADLVQIYKDLGLENKNVLRVGNLPYYITSPIFRKLFVDFDLVDRGIFMIQKEVGEKIRIDATDKSYLWRLLNYKYEAKYLKTVPAKAFAPAPKVQSCYVEFVRKTPENIDFAKLLFLLDNISAYKRKTLGKIWKMIEKKGITEFVLPESLGSKRIQELTREDMKSILN